jgi:hypothetical protein
MSSSTIPNVGVEIPEITQIGFVVEDLEDGMDRFGSLLGIGPWDVYRFEPPSSRRRRTAARTTITR